MLLSTVTLVATAATTKHSVKTKWHHVLEVVVQQRLGDVIISCSIVFSM